MQAFGLDAIFANIYIYINIYTYIYIYISVCVCVQVKVLIGLPTRWTEGLGLCHVQGALPSGTYCNALGHTVEVHGPAAAEQCEAEGSTMEQYLSKVQELRC